MPLFKSNQPLRARDLNGLQALAAQQGLQSPSAALYNNGNGVVPRNPRTATNRVRESEYAKYSDVVPAKIVSGSAAAGYRVDLYADGYTAGRTGTGNLFMMESACNNAFDLPAGTAVLAHICLVSLTGGSDE